MTPRELKPCPCCGNEAERRSDGDCEDYPYWIVCSVCTIQTGPFGDMEFAEQEWNTRAALPEQPLSRKWREVGQEWYGESRKCNDDYGRGYCRGYTDASEKCADDLDAQQDNGREEIRRLRILLAMAYSGGNLYADDGELQDASTYPFIDWKRDSLEELERKVKERGYDRILKHLEGDSDEASED